MYNVIAVIAAVFLANEIFFFKTEFQLQYSLNKQQTVKLRRS